MSKWMGLIEDGQWTGWAPFGWEFVICPLSVVRCVEREAICDWIP